MALSFKANFQLFFAHSLLALLLQKERKRRHWKLLVLWVLVCVIHGLQTFPQELHSGTNCLKPGLIPDSKMSRFVGQKYVWHINNPSRIDSKYTNNIYLTKALIHIIPLDSTTLNQFCNRFSLGIW